MKSSFFYYEEADWQRRMADRGWQGAFLPETTAIHWVGQSGGKDRLRYTILAHEGSNRFIRKHDGWMALQLARGAFIAGCGLRLFWHLPQTLHGLFAGKQPSFGVSVNYRLFRRNLTGLAAELTNTRRRY